MFNVSTIRTALRTSRTLLGSQRRATTPAFTVRNKGLHTSTAAQQESKKDKSKPKHTPETYAKEVDETPAADSSVHRVDPDSDRVQKLYEAPSGYSRAGVESEEYRHVEGTSEPYAPEGGSKGTYGARPELAERQGKATSGPEEGPSGKSSGGRQ